jgi:hypothetical protein
MKLSCHQASFEEMNKMIQNALNAEGKIKLYYSPIVDFVQSLNIREGFEGIEEAKAAPVTPPFTFLDKKDKTIVYLP